MSTVQRHHVRDGVAIAALFAAVGMLALQLSQFARNVVLALSRPERALTYTGGIVAALSRNGELVYAPLSQPPFFPTIYPPIYPLLVNSLRRLTTIPVPVLQRVLGLGCIIASSYLIWRITRHITDHDIAAIGAAALWLLSPAVSRATVLSRVDALAMVFGLAAVTVVAIYRQDRWLWAGFLTALALFTKHSLVAIPATIVLIYALRRQYREGLLYVAVVATVGVIGLAALSFTTGGRALVHLLVINAVQPFSVGRLIGQLTWMAWTHFAILLATLYAIARHGRTVPPVVVALPITGALVAVATMGKLGSWIGYAYPLIAGACIATGWLIARHAPTDPRKWTRGATATVGAAVLLVLAAQFGLYASWAPSTPTHMDNQQATLEYIDGAESVLSIDPSVDRDGTPFAPFVMQYVRERGLWKDRVKPRIAAQKYEYIVLWHPPRPEQSYRWSPGQMAAVAANYELVERYGRYRIYAPVEEDNV